MALAVELDEVTKHYQVGAGVVRALDGVSLEIAAGEFVAVIGRSGSGKTTLLDLLGLLLQPTGGRIRLDGVDTGRLDDGRRATLRGERIGFVFQDFNLLPALTALENVMLPLRYRRTRRDRDGRRRALGLLDEVGLGDRLEHRPHQLSGGQAQRVAIARALVNEPSLLLGDEPTGEVDSDTAAGLLDLLQRLNRERGVTLVVVTHDLEIAARADRVIKLRDGRVDADERRVSRAG
jgi:putative ABC transport system ATP-binding protein